MVLAWGNVPVRNHQIIFRWVSHLNHLQQAPDKRQVKILPVKLY